MTTILIAVAVQVAVSLSLIVWTRAKVRRFLGSEDEIGKIRREIGALIVELDSSADRNVTVLEDRLTALKDLVAEADKRISLLGQEKARRQSEETVYDRLGRQSERKRAPAAEPARQPEPVRTPEAAVRPEPVPAAEPPRHAEPIRPAEPIRKAEPSVPFIRFSDKPLDLEEPFADKVISLSRRGFSSDIIAARLGATMAEVDIVISMDRDGRAKEI